MYQNSHPDLRLLPEYQRHEAIAQELGSELYEVLSWWFTLNSEVIIESATDILCTTTIARAYRESVVRGCPTRLARFAKVRCTISVPLTREVSRRTASVC